MSSKSHRDNLLDPGGQLSLFDNMGDGVCVSANGNIQFMNRYLIEKFGNQVGEPFYKIFPPEGMPCDTCENVHLKREGLARYEWYSPESGQVFDIINSTFNTQQETVSTVSIFRDITEQKKLHKRLEGYYSKLKETNKELKLVNRTLSSANQKLEELSIKDELTGLFNQRHFWESLSLEYKRATRYDTPLSCIMIDIDLFKSVNDLGSHAFGDYCLSEVGSMIRSPLRAMDVPARYGGEEFAVILPSTHYFGARIISEKIREKIEGRPFRKEDLLMNLTVSIGVSSLPEDRVDHYNLLVEFADKALYAAKMQGRNRVCLYRDLRVKERDTKFGAGKISEIGTTLLHIMEGVKRDYIEATINFIHSIEFKEKFRDSHLIQVSRYAARIAEFMNLNKEQIDSITYAALLHDLGHIALNYKILLKKGPLTNEEYETVKEHPVISAHIIEPVKCLQEEFHYIFHHHEKYDGSGYPYGLKGEDIPLGARILSAADAYDAMKSERPYRKPLSQKAIQNEFITHSGTQFDPELTGIILRLIKEENVSDG